MFGGDDCREAGGRAMQEQLPRGGLLRASRPPPRRGRRCAAFKFAPGEFVEPNGSRQRLPTPQIRKAPRGGLSYLAETTAGKQEVEQCRSNCRGRDYSGYPCPRPFGAALGAVKFASGEFVEHPVFSMISISYEGTLSRSRLRVAMVQRHAN